MTKVKNVHYRTLERPVITEKAHIRTTEGKYTFFVSIDADKKIIKSSVEAVFGVEVTAVNTIVRKGKTKRFKGVKGRRKDQKIAIVTLAEGQSIDFESAA